MLAGRRVTDQSTTSRLAGPTVTYRRASHIRRD